MYVKAMTTDCEKCSYLKVEDNGEFRCRWGKSKTAKKLTSPKGKNLLQCNLLKKGKK
jgi:hypothetical protein